MSVFTTKTMKQYLRPVVEDAAGSLDSAGYATEDEAMAWFDGADVEALQETVMHAVQAAILFALDYGPPLPDFDGVLTVEERESV